MTPPQLSGEVSSLWPDRWSSMPRDGQRVVGGSGLPWPRTEAPNAPPVELDLDPRSAPNGTQPQFTRGCPAKKPGGVEEYARTKDEEPRAINGLLGVALQMEASPCEESRGSRRRILPTDRRKVPQNKLK